LYKNRTTKIRCRIVVIYMGAKPSSTEAPRPHYPAEGWVSAPSLPPSSPDPRPSDSHVLAEFREKLNSLPLTSDQKLILQEQSVDIKHKLLCKLRELQTEGVVGKDAAQILHIIQSSPTQRSFRQLLKWLKAAEDSLVADFIAAEGIDVLVNMLIVSQELARNTQNYEKQTLLLRALAHLNTYEDGTLELISDEMKVVYVALSVSVEDECSSVLAVDMMVDLCWYSSEGYDVVTKSMEVLALERGLQSVWEFFIEVLRSKSCKYCYKYKAMTLLNTMVQSALEPEVQAKTRAKLLSLDLSSTLQTLKADIEEIAPARRRNIRPFQLQTKHHRLPSRDKSTASSKTKRTALQVFDPDNTDGMARSRDRHRRSDHLVRPSEDLLDAKVNEIIHSTIDVSAISAFVQKQGEAEEDGEELSDEDYALALLDQIQLFEEEGEIKEESVKSAVVEPANLIQAVEQAARTAGTLDLFTDILTSLLQLPVHSRQSWTRLKEVSATLGKLQHEEQVEEKLVLEQRNELEAMRKSLEDLSKSLEERDREIEKLWGKKKKWMGKKADVKREMEELRREVAGLKSREKELYSLLAGRTGVESKERHLSLQRTEEIRLLGKPVGTQKASPSVPPVLSIGSAQSSAPSAPVLTMPGLSRIAETLAPPAPVLSLSIGAVQAGNTMPSLPAPLAPQVSIPNSIPPAPTFNLPSAAPTAPSLSLPNLATARTASPLLPTVSPISLSQPTPSSIPQAPILTPAAPTLSLSLAKNSGVPAAPLLPTVTPVAPTLSIPLGPSLPKAPSISLPLGSSAPVAPLLPPMGTPPAPSLSLSSLGTKTPLPLVPTVSPVTSALLNVPQAPMLPAAPSLSLPTGKGAVPVAPLLTTVSPIGLSLSPPSAPALPSLSPTAPTLPIPLAPCLPLGSVPMAPSLTVPKAPQLATLSPAVVPSAPQLAAFPLSSTPSAPSLSIPSAPMAPSLSLSLGNARPLAPNLLLGNPNALPIAPVLSGSPVPPSAPVLGVPTAPSLSRPQAPNLPSAPGAPNLGMFATSPVTPSLPPKEKRKPAAPTKSLFWTPIAAQKFASSVWRQVDDSKVQIDEESLLSLFAQKKAAPKAASAETPVEQKVTKISLFPKERSQNVQLLLGKLRMSNSAIVEALLAIDEKVLTKNNSITLRAGMPTDEEMAQLQGYEEDPSQLGVTERFFLSLKEVPMPAIRIDAQIFVVNCTEMVEELSGKLRKLESTLGSFQSSSRFKHLLEVVLALGNYLNGSSARGGAYGFSVSGLTKVAEMKAQDNKTTLLEYIVQCCFKQSPDLLQLREDFQDLEEASKGEV